MKPELPNVTPPTGIIDPVNNSWLEIPARITPVSLTLPKSLSYEQWAEIGVRIARLKRFTAWALSDWMNHGEQRWGEMYAHSADATGFEPNYPAIIKSVGASVDVCRRRESLSFSHHRLVASLEPDLQEKFLREAEKNNWRREELRHAIIKSKSLEQERHGDVAQNFKAQTSLARANDLLKEAERLALKYADGHLTIMRFTTGWKVMLDTPDLDTGDGRDHVATLKTWESLEDALRDLVEYCTSGKLTEQPNGRIEKMDHDNVVLLGGTDVEIIVANAQCTAEKRAWLASLRCEWSGCTDPGWDWRVWREVASPMFKANTPPREYVFVCEKHAELNHERAD